MLQLGLAIGMTSNSTNGPVQFSLLAPPLDSRITFTRADATTCASYFNSSGAMTLAAANVPRFGYNPNTLVAEGLLIEASMQNLLLNSATLSTQTVSVGASTYTLSFYGTGTVVLSGAYVGTVTGTGAYPTRTSLTFTASAGSLVATVTGTVQYANLENNSFATSWISTGGSSAIRVADSATSTASLPGATGTVIISGVVGTSLPASGNGEYFYSLDDTTSNNEIVMYIDSTGNTHCRWIKGGSSQASLASVATLSPGAAFTIGFSWSAGNFAASLNGATCVTSSSGSIPTITTRRLGDYAYGGAANGFISSVTEYNYQVPNATLQALT